MVRQLLDWSCAGCVQAEICSREASESYTCDAGVVMSGADKAVQKAGLTAPQTNVTPPHRPDPSAPQTNVTPLNNQTPQPLRPR